MAQAQSPQVGASEGGDCPYHGNMLRTFLAVTLLTCSVNARAETLQGSAKVVDGDTLIVAGERVRLRNVDAPELDQPGGRAAADYLAALVKGRVVVCDVAARDRWARAVASCRAGQVELGEQLIAAGHGRWHAR